MKFSELPQFTSVGNWEVSFEFKYFIQWILKEIENGLVLNPDFQRGHVWTEEQQVAFVEYYLKGGQIGVIYLNAPEFPSVYKDGEYVCVDGLQRITALMRFYSNEIKIFGRYLYKDFTDRPKYDVRVNVNNLKSRKEVLKWYIDLNSGGTPHSSEEINRVKELLEKEGQKV